MTLYVNYRIIKSNLSTYLIILLTPFFLKAQTNFVQLGGDIDGEAAGDFSSFKSMALNSDGDRVAIGAYANDGGGSDRGHVRVYEYSSSSWSQLGSDIDGEANSDVSGSAVSLNSDGDRVAIGAYDNDGSGDKAGHVRVYEYSSGSWSQLGGDIDGEASQDYSGSAVSLNSNGDRVAIGAKWNDGGGNKSGHVRIYEYSSGAWNKLGSDIDGEAANDYSGYSVSLDSDGNRVAIGAIENDGSGDKAGHVRVYEYSSGAWNKLGSDIDGEAANDYFGYSVSLDFDGDRVAIGAYANDGGGNNAGHVRLYEYSSGSWTQLGSDIDGEAANDYSGYSVSLASDGNRVAIGGRLNDGGGNNAGHVRLYEYSSGAWNKLGSDIDGEAANDVSGGAVSLNSDGDRVAIGADSNDGGGENAGHVRVFQYDATVPTISSVSLASDNSTIAATFSEAVYTTTGGSSALIVGDFALSISGGTATLSSATPSSISISGNVYTLGISLSGTPNGSETLTVNPASSTSIYDGADNAAASSQSNNTATLNEKIVPTVVFDPPNESENISETFNITLTFSKAVRKTDDTVLDNGTVDAVVTLKNEDVNGTDIAFDATINEEKTVITVNPTNNFLSEQTIYVSIADSILQDYAGNVFEGASSTFTSEDLIPPSPFDLVYPLDSTTIVLTRDNFLDTLYFAWNQSVDSGGDAVTYKKELTGDLPNYIKFIVRSDHDSTDNMYKVPYHHIEEYMHEAGVEIVSGTWNIIASDGDYEVPAYNGPFSLTIDGSSLSVNNSSLPHEFQLHSNFPNPFNPSTSISYSLSEQVFVSLDVYDVLGKKVKSLVSEIKSTGNHSILWDGTNDQGELMSGGVYIYSINAGNFHASKKMIFIK